MALSPQISILVTGALVAPLTVAAAYVTSPVVEIMVTGALVAPLTISVTPVTSPVLEFPPAVAGMEVTRWYLTPLFSPVIEIEATGAMAVRGFVPLAAVTLRSGILDVLSLFGLGCCAEPPECLLEEAITALNSALQQFHLSEKAHEFLTGQKVQTYSAPTNSEIFIDGAQLPATNADTVGVAKTYNVQHVQRVIFSDTGTGKTHHLRPVSATTLIGALIGGGTAAGVSMGEWYEDAAPSDPPSSSDVPFFFEIFRDVNKRPMIRCFPDGSGVVDGIISVHLTPAARHVTVLDFTNGVGFDIAPAYVELYLMPLARHAALHSVYADPLNAPQKAAVEARYKETLAFLGLASIETPSLEK